MFLLDRDGHQGRDWPPGLAIDFLSYHLLIVFYMPCTAYEFYLYQFLPTAFRYYILFYSEYSGSLSDTLNYHLNLSLLSPISSICSTRYMTDVPRCYQLKLLNVNPSIDTTDLGILPKPISTSASSSFLFIPGTDICCHTFHTDLDQVSASIC